MTAAGMLELAAVEQVDRELFIFLLGFDAVSNEGGFQRILDGEFDHWKKMQAIARHRIAAQAGLVWQPIETAPKDGTEFQAWVVNTEGARGFWEPRCRISADSEAFEIWGRVDYDEDGWVSFDHLIGTHWMPEPVSPGREQGLAIVAAALRTSAVSEGEGSDASE